MGHFPRLFEAVPRPIQMTLLSVLLLIAYGTPVTISPSVPFSYALVLALAVLGSVGVAVLAVYTDRVSTRAAGGFLVGSLVGFVVGAPLAFVGSGSVLLLFAVNLGVGLVGAVLATR